MSNTIYATFATEADAERAAGALIDHGLPAQDVSYILPEAPVHTDYAGKMIPTPPSGGTDANAPVSTHAARPTDVPVTDAWVPDLAGSARLPVDTAGRMPAEGTSIRQEPGALYERVSAVQPGPGVMNIATPDAQVVSAPAATPAIPADTPQDVVQHEHRPHIVDMHRARPEAAGGVSTTTVGDAGKGAMGGAGIGVGLGIFLGLAAVAIPGIGFVAGTGALVAGLAAATGAAGGIAGGVYGYLVDLGLPAERARMLDEHLRGGGPILSIAVTGTVPEGEIIQLLKKYGATSAEAY